MKFLTLFIVRGLPGSGKSSIADHLAGENHTNQFDGSYRVRIGSAGVVFTTDAYFYQDWEHAENYVYDPALIGKYHGMNKSAVKKYMQSEFPILIVDNTNTTEWEVKPYYQLAKEFGYKVVVVEVPHTSVDDCAERNSHGVPVETLKKMENRWESLKLKGTDGKSIDKNYELKALTDARKIFVDEVNSYHDTAKYYFYVRDGELCTEVSIVSSKFWNKNKCLSDQHLTSKLKKDKMLPDFLEELMESIFESTLSVEETRAKMIELGFEENAEFEKFLNY